MTGFIGTDLINVLFPTTVVVINGLVLTVNKNVPVLACKAVSLTVTENVVAVIRYLVGVPVISPVLPAKFNPSGSVGLIVYAKAP